MGRLNLMIPDELEAAFREKAMKKFGYKRGSPNKALTEAVELWVKQGI